MKFSIFSVGFLLTCAGSVYAQQNDAAPVRVLANKTDSVAYAFGSSIGRELKQTGLEQVNTTVLAQAIADLLAGKSPVFDENQERELIMQAITAAREKQNAPLKAEASAFMENNKVKPGVQTTASGIQYEIIREGTGDRPVSADTVTVHYKGQLSNGSVIDSSYDRGEPATFPLSRVIPGWTEGLQLMPVGAHYRLYIPYELGYGERGAGPNIPPYSPLIFDVELIAIKKVPESQEPADTLAGGR